MPCYHPLQAWLPVGGSLSKKVLFKESKECGREIRLSCGQCIGCRLEYSRQWAVRCLHEAKCHKYNCFITLTFDDENIPKNGSLDKKDFQDFMKRFRKLIKSRKFIAEYGFYCKKLRYFHCGEYGEKRGRPHYHACIFGFDFPDRKYYKTVKGCDYYTSDILSKLWPFGMCVIGDVTFESAAYVARYVCKKINGETSAGVPEDIHYALINEFYDIDYDTGEILPKLKEYTTMSRRPGIGRDFYDKYKDDIYSSDSVVMRGYEMKPPKYYDGLYEVDNLVHMDNIKFQREVDGRVFNADNSKERLAVKEVVQKAKLSVFSKRDLE